MEVSDAAPETQGGNNQPEIIRTNTKCRVSLYVVVVAGQAGIMVDSSLLCLKMHWQWFGATLYIMCSILTLTTS